MMKPVVPALVLLCCVPGAAQDPITAVPEAYKLQFENEVVRVVRVHYAAGAKLPEHTHPAGTTAYVYLNDSDGVIFRHAGGSSRALPRPAVKTGSIRLSAGSEEHHNAENPGATPSNFLRIQFKTLTSRNLRQRIPRGTFRQGESSITVDYTSEPLVIQRFIIPAGKSMQVPVTESAAMPSLWVAVPSGETRWVESAPEAPVTNSGETTMEWLRFIARGASKGPQ